VFAVLLGVVVLGEVPAAVQVVGIAAVALGMGRAARNA
jgi:drug/metabolite transporter (DMT)-like permease